MSPRRRVTYRITCRSALLAGAGSIVFGVAIACAITIAGLAQSGIRNAGERVARGHRVITAWNEAATVNNEEIPLLLELQENLRNNPPHLVYDPRRRELYKQIIAAHEAQTAAFKVMQENDK